VIREILKTALQAACYLAVTPFVLSFRCRALLLGPDRAVEGSSQLFALLPGLLGQYLRNAFLRSALAGCHRTAVVGFGTVFSKAGARIDENAYVGPYCTLGLVHVGHDALLAAGVHVPSGSRTHGIADTSRPIREQPGELQMVQIGAGSWIGNGAIVLADVGPGSVVAAGAVVTRPLPDRVIAAGVPARVLRRRDSADIARPAS
jgi:virginiamycin A acetyltransferase